MAEGMALPSWSKKKDPGHKQSVKMRTLLVMRRSLLLASEPGKWILSTVYSLNIKVKSIMMYKTGLL